MEKKCETERRVGLMEVCVQPKMSNSLRNSAPGAVPRQEAPALRPL